MTFKKIVLIISFLLLTCGCSERPLSPVIEKEMTFYNLPERPRELNAFTDKAGLSSVLVDYCWNEDLEMCQLEILNPAKSLEGIRTQVVEEGGKIRFLFDVSPELKAPLPTGEKLYSFEDDVPYEVEFNSDGTFTIPDEKGRHNFGYLAKFDGDIKGQAYFGFALIVK